MTGRSLSSPPSPSPQTPPPPSPSKVHPLLLLCMQVDGPAGGMHLPPANLYWHAQQVDGLSHVVHSEEEAMGTRITIDSLTCLLANESDPSRLIASSPGKLTRYLLPDGSHVKNDQPYAEVEVRRSGSCLTCL